MKKISIFFLATILSVSLSAADEKTTWESLLTQNNEETTLEITEYEENSLDWESPIPDTLKGVNSLIMNKISTEHATALITNIQNSTKVDLWYIEITQELWAAIQKNAKKLKALDISWPQKIDLPEQAKLPDGISSATLYEFHNKLEYELDELKKIINTLPNSVTKLKIQEINQDTLDKILSLLENLSPNITKIILTDSDSDSDIDKETITKIADHCPNLRKINDTIVNQLEDLITLDGTLKLNKDNKEKIDEHHTYTKQDCKKIKKLQISDITSDDLLEMPSNFLGLVIKKSKQIKEIYLDKVHIKKKLWKKAVKHAKDTLTSIQIKQPTNIPANLDFSPFKKLTHVTLQLATNAEPNKKSLADIIATLPASVTELQLFYNDLQTEQDENSGITKITGAEFKNLPQNVTQITINDLPKTEGKKAKQVIETIKKVTKRDTLTIQIPNQNLGNTDPASINKTPASAYWWIAGAIATPVVLHLSYKLLVPTQKTSNALQHKLAQTNLMPPKHVALTNPTGK